MLRIHSRHFLAGDLLFGTRRQVHSDCCSLSDFAFRRYSSAGLVGKAVNLRQTEPGSFVDFLGREKRIEDLGQKIWRNAHAGVAKLYRDEGSVMVIITQLVIGNIVDG